MVKVIYENKLKKDDIKNKTSEIIKRIIPIHIPLYTIFMYLPENVASRITSRHHIYIHKKVQGIDKSIDNFIKAMKSPYCKN